MNTYTLIAPQVDLAVQEILVHSILDNRNGAPDEDYLKEVLSNMVVDAIEVYCDNIKELK